MAAIETTLAAEESSALLRFGLEATADGAAVRLLPDGRFPWWPEVHVQAADRRGWAGAQADGLLLRLTGHANYRSDTQKAAVRGLVTQPPGSGMMISMPTGGGKSLLFQVAALQGKTMEEGACVVVVVPTVALALDHERTLASMPGLEGSRALTGDLSPEASRDVLAAFRRGEVPVLLLSPEKAFQAEVASSLAEAASRTSEFVGLDARLTHLFVDEAHIVESWGRSFRPDFQRLPGLLERLRGVNPDVRLILLSATLAPSAKRVLRADWRLGGDWLEIDARVPRFEHDVVVAAFGSPAERRDALDWTIDRVPRPAIVYTTEVAEAERLHARLSAERGYGRVALFTGATGAADRRDVVDRWAREELDLVVATSAFGMGVDKSNVRAVVHACLPEGPARWYQEIGRAARDGGQALAVTLFTDMAGGDDVARAFDLATSGWLGIDLGRSRWEALLASASNRRRHGEVVRMTVDLDALRDGLGPTSGDYNRRWNMALLTLMQRAGVIRIVSVASDDGRLQGFWEVEILDTSILEGAGADVWSHVLEVRDGERRDAVDELVPFVDLMRHPRRACVMRSVFELVEPGSYAPPCGRCPSCRSEGVRPPSGLRSQGMEKVWEVHIGYEGPLPGGVVILDPLDAVLSDGLGTLLRRLAAVGVQQFIVDAEISDAVADILAGEDGPGLVVRRDDWCAGAGLVGVATALLLPTSDLDAALATSRLTSWSTAKPDVPAIVVGRRERVLEGRRLDQFASSHAPLPEAALDALIPLTRSLTERG